jgi:hypothetical protein
VSYPYGYGSYYLPSTNPGTVLVDDAAGISKGAILSSDGTNSELGAAWLDLTGFSVAGQQQSMSFSLNVLAAPTDATMQPKILDGGVFAGITLGMNTYTSNGWAFRFAAVPTSENGGIFGFRSPDNTAITSFFDYDEKTTYQVRIDSDYSTGLLNAYVNGVKELDGFAFWTSGAPNVVTNEYFFHLNGEPGIDNSVAIDNIRAFATPEPSSYALCLAALGAIFLLARKRSAPGAALNACL